MKQTDIPLYVKDLSEATSSKIGQDYFDALVTFLGSVLKKKYVLIGELTNDSTAIRTRSVFSSGNIIENVTYELEDTPCESVVTKNACVFREGIQNLYPRDSMLQEMEVDSYVGAPLFNSEGDAFGLIVILDTKPISDESFIQVYFDLVVGRISAELERATAMERLQEQEERFRDLVYCSSDLIWEINEEFKYTYSTSTVDGILGYAPQELIGKTPFDIMPEKEAERVMEAFAPIAEAKEAFSGLENINIHKNDSVIYIESSGVPIFDANNQFRGYRGVDRDITERKKKEIDLKLAATVLNTASEAVMVTDVSNKIIKVNEAFTHITGYSPEDALGQTPSILKSGHHGSDFYIEMRRGLRECDRWEGEIWNRKKSGEVYPEWLTISPMTGPQGEPQGYVCLFSDITKRKQAEEQIQYQANYDALTGLANRHLLLERFSTALDYASRAGDKVSLFFIDLDRFKQVNDSLGHSFGDRLIAEAAKRLHGCIRKTDTAARLGGDEFAIVCSGMPGVANIDSALTKILKVMSEPYYIDRQKIVLSASIGVTIFPNDGVSIEELTRNADSAMYKAKEKGGNTYQFFTEEMHAESLRRHIMEGYLRSALENQEFVLNYQPIVETVSKKIVGCEALIRWHSPELGLVNPVDFIPLAEETGLIIPIGEWVLQEACKQTALFIKQVPDNFFISVNVSSYQFRNVDMCAVVKKTLSQVSLSPSVLALEITESLMMNEDVAVREQLQELRNYGVSISIDDFGTGYSSLSYLHKYPLSTLKIDKEFIQELATNESKSLLVDAIISMSKSLGLKVIAEGIEEEAQVEILRDKGCEYLQGYLFSRPIELTEFKALLKA
ncbi:MULTISPECIES: EAL domain-containing protein [unclassified Neptuniibacter]|uniref:sensor domain-containing protein n=1 Tax=unclassified Neptuniibacter TaxID=2630693 RepID=UPI000C3850D8|nr:MULTISPECIES: EAL domain-containing protein [unclassified Neptuniibacter]MAY42851.1 GGDEF domain-containing protein [Oceanospirillaceae bacterium]|tara:strand:+ start:1711 stop:4239 length:2529 start_codon:yes stop_codon:yes gene_type:complete